MKNKMEITVGQEHTAKKYGSGAIEVYATPAMIALMENTAKDCIDTYLPQGYTTVGTEVNIKHMKATPVGSKIICEATLEVIDRKRLQFKVEAWDEVGKIGEGSHSRFIVNADEFMSKLQK